MNPVSGKDFCKLLEKNGWMLLRISGSHHIYGRLGNAIKISVPVHGSQPLKLGLYKKLLKFAQLD